MDDLESRLFERPLDELDRQLSYSRRLECVWRLIQAEFADAAVTLDQAARACGISKSHLNALLNERVGLSFHQLLTRYRIFKAAAMMKSKDYTFLEIASETGFESQANLARHIQRVFGVSPRQFRRQIR